MSEPVTVEQRLLAVEKALAEIQTRLRLPRRSNWVERFNGAFAGEAAFDEVTELGRRLREADRDDADAGP